MNEPPPITLSGLALCVVLALFSGCAAPLANATIAVNDTRSVLAVARESIDERCIPAYQAAKTPADVAKVDAVCLPARQTYLTARSAWMSAVAVVIAVRAGGDPTTIGPAVLQMAETATMLANAIPQVMK